MASSDSSEDESITLVDGTRVLASPLGRGRTPASGGIALKVGNEIAMLSPSDARALSELVLRALQRSRDAA